MAKSRTGRTAARDTRKTRKGGGDGRLVLVTAKPCATAADLVEGVVEFLWTQRLPLQEAICLAGAAESGKSTLMSALAAAVTTGRELPGGPAIRPRSVLWYGSEERGAEIIRPRLRVAGADLSRVFLPEYDLDGSHTRSRPRLPRDADKVAQLAQEVDAALLVLDPIGSYIEADLPQDAGPTARAICEALASIGRRANLAAMFVKHPKKYGAAQSPIEQVAGNREWTNTPRSVLLAGPHPDRPGSYCLASLKGSVRGRAATLCYRLEFPGEVPMIVWEEEGGITPEQLLDSAGSPAERDHLADARALIEDLIAETGAVKVKDLLKAAEEAAISPHFLRKGKKQLGLIHERIGPNDTRYVVWKRRGGPPEPQGA